MSLLQNPQKAAGGGRKTVASAGTAEALTATNTHTVTVSITAETNNTGLVAVGDSAVVAAAGTQTNVYAILNAGDTVSLDVPDSTLLFLDVTVSGDGVAFGYLVP
jgi:hypothetical protein